MSFRGGNGAEEPESKHKCPNHDLYPLEECLECRKDTCVDCNGLGTIRHHSTDKTKWDFCYACEGTGVIFGDKK